VTTTTSSVAAAASLNCSSSRPDIVQVAASCAYVFLNGSEAASGDAVITMTTSGLPSYNFTLKVWAPQVPISLSVADDTLNSIQGWYNSSNGCQPMFQITPVQATVVFQYGNASSMSVFLAPTDPLLKSRLVSTNPLVAQVVTFSNQASIQGLSQGQTNLMYRVGTATLATLPITVSNDPVRVDRLRLAVILSMSIALNASSPLSPSSSTLVSYSATQTLTQELQTAGIELSAILSDGSPAMQLTAAMGATITSLNPSIADIPSFNVVRARSTGSGMLLNATWASLGCNGGAIFATGLGLVRIFGAAECCCNCQNLKITIFFECHELSSSLTICRRLRHCVCYRDYCSRYFYCL
jgi:hypothetical protein